MEKYVYIKKDILHSLFIDFEEQLNPDLYDNLGTTWEDYLDNKWVLLSDAQVAYLEAHPYAGREEVWNMAKPLSEAIEEKIAQIEEYDQSDNVNSFTIGGLQMWLTIDERQQLATQINANKAIGRESMTKWFGGQEFTFPISVWEQMLVALEVYCGDALNVTESHKAAVRALKTLKKVAAFDITAGYPEKLVFNS